MRNLPVLMLVGLMLARAEAMPGRDYHFQVLLDGDPVGSHRFEFVPVENGYRLTSIANYLVKVLFVPVYRYEHRSDELWQGGCLAQIESVTNDNGKKFELSGSRRSSVFELRVNQEELEYPDSCISTFAYWQPALLQANRLLNSQTGKLMNVGYTNLGPSSLPWDASRQADVLLLKAAQGEIWIWYNQGQWLGLRSQLKNGRVLLYRPFDALPSSDTSMPKQ